MIFFIIALLIVVIVCCITVGVVNKEYEKFVLNHSVAIRQLQELNERTEFKQFDNISLSKKYDNEHFFDEISPKDYLVYYLADKQFMVSSLIAKVRDNQKAYSAYSEKIGLIRFNKYDTEKIPKNSKKLSKTEQKLFKKVIKQPKLEFSIDVTLYQTNINGKLLFVKRWSFGEREIQALIVRINNKSNDFYLDEEIWKSLCKVERGNVSNKMRFAIYSRDGYRCCKCGKTTDDLEIDHIYPISKGGKSVPENLQTLCHSCNYKKSNTVESVPENCPKCNAKLILKNGKYGRFYGCTNYPNCKFIHKL